MGKGATLFLDHSTGRVDQRNTKLEVVQGR